MTTDLITPAHAGPADHAILAACAPDSYAVTVTARARRLMCVVLERAALSEDLARNEAAEVVDTLVEAAHTDLGDMLAAGRRRRCGDTHQHCVHVGLLLAALARRLGMPPRATRQAVMAGVLHDIGKAFVPADILLKPGPLTPEERRTIHRHPTWGATLLRDTDAIPAEVVTAVEHHHERLDGTGYPHALPGREIGLFARMTAVVDVYDALSAVRPYHCGRTGRETLRYLARASGRRRGRMRYDGRLLAELILAVGVHPPGTLVRLSDGHQAVVTAPGREPARPCVRVIQDAWGRPLPEPVDVDLAAWRTVTIRRAVDGEGLPG